jgi:nucleoid DNA-binding protein
MQKNDIIFNIAQATGLHQTAVKEIVQLTLAGMIDTLASEGRLEWRNFGVFTVKNRKARKARNPMTGAPALAPAHKAVAFKPGKIMLDKIRGKSAPSRRRKPRAKALA